MRRGCIELFGVVLAAACTRPGPADVPADWSGTTIATYCEPNQPCPPAMLDLGSRGGDTVYGGVPASGRYRCGDRRSEYRIATADIENGAVDYRRLQQPSPTIRAEWMFDAISLDDLKP